VPEARCGTSLIDSRGEAYQQLFSPVAAAKLLTAFAGIAPVHRIGKLSAQNSETDRLEPEN
jgi:hypothetical protein